MRADARRHRDKLVAVVHAAELEDLARAARVLLDDLTLDAALREWLVRYTRFTATERGMIGTLLAWTAQGRAPMSTTRGRGSPRPSLPCSRRGLRTGRCAPTWRPTT